MVKDNEDFKLPCGAGAIGDETVCLLESSAFVFHLGGSYFFGCATMNSDVDFIVQHSEAVVDWLEQNGFETYGGVAYSDVDPTVQITYGIYEKGDVQVSVVFNLPAKLIARDILSKYFAAEHLEANRETRNAVWSRLIDAIARVAENFKPVASLDLPF